MGLIVQKFGGSSVANAERIRNVARIITDTYKAGNDVVVVLSAQGDTTDELIEKAAELNPRASKREMDMLLATGEQQSIALCAMTIEGMGFPVVSLTGWQVGMNTNSTYSNARIKRVDGERIRSELDKKRIVIVAGFQGINKYGDVTTLGRGGSDTSAVALAATLGADLCQIYTDVDGVYTADPRKVKGARKLEEISFDEMLELATLGSQVLHNRSVEMAKRYDVKGKTYFKYPNKYYYTDVGLRNARLNYRQYDPGHIMENIIYNELLRRGYSVDVGVVTDRTGGANVQKEIDFVVNDADKKIYIQSAFQMDTDKKESSELASLMLTKDFFKKIIVRMDIPHNFYDDSGIFHCNLIDLLLGRVELF